MLLFTLVFVQCSTQKRIESNTKDYAGIIQSSLKILGWDLNGFYFRASPVGNFGIGTMYLKQKDVNDPKIIESNWLLSNPNIWFEETLPETNKQAILKRIIINGSFGSFNTSDSTVTSNSSKLSLPLFKLLSLDASLDMEKGVKSSISASKAILRKMAWPEFEQAVIENKFSKSLIRVYNNNNYIIAADDIILTGYKVNIEIDNSINPQLSAKLTSEVGKIIGSEANGSFKLKKVGQNKFEAIADQDVVVALLFKDPPPLADRGSGPGEWKTAKIDKGDLDKIESFVKGQ